VDSVVTWDPIPGAPDVVYDVVRGDLENLREMPGAIELGPLTCIEEDSPDTTTAGNEDRERPGAGRGFFYLVRYDVGVNTGPLGVGSVGFERGGSDGCE
jgi:hypothetical protein